MNVHIKKILDVSVVKFELNGNNHREGGPSVEWVDGAERWFLNGKEYSEEEYWEVLNEYSR